MKVFATWDIPDALRNDLLRHLHEPPPHPSRSRAATTRLRSLKARAWCGWC
jgi:hypothetical protein